MSLTERYLDEVRRNVFAPPEQRDQFLSDLKTHIEEAVARGETEAEAVGKLGNATDVALEFMSSYELKPAGFWARSLAFSIDLSLKLSIMLLVPFLLSLPLLLSRLSQGYSLPDALRISIEGASVMGIITIGLIISWVVLMMIVFLIYFPVLEKLYGTTFGKRVLKMRVIKEGGGAIGFSEAILRRISFYIDILFFDALFIPFNKKKQRAFDMVAKTMVVYEPWLKVPGWMITAAVVVSVLPIVAFGVFMGLLLMSQPM